MFVILCSRRFWRGPLPAILVLMSAACVSAPDKASEPVDLLIRNARVVDGTGNPWYRADLAVHNGRISAVGELAETRAVRTIDAAERVAAPGFIDVHTHIEGRGSRAGIEELPEAGNFLMDGVTTVVTGNCGSSELEPGSWFDRLDDLQPGINVATLIGHNSVRRAVMGEANRAPAAEELERMQAIVERAMQEGAVGLSTGLLYIPGTFAATEEVIALATTAGRYGGVYSTHLRNQAAGLTDSIAEAARIGREAGVAVQLSHLKIKGRNRWGTIDEALGLIEGFRREGLDIRADAYPYERASTSLGVNLPAWSRAGSREELRARLRDPETRTRIVAEMHVIRDELGFDDYAFATVASFSPEPDLAGLTIPEVAVRRGRSPDLAGQIETILEMLEAGNASMVYHYMSEADVARILAAPATSVASDGGTRRAGQGLPHPRSYGTNARVLRRFVAELGVLTLEDAIRRMTSLPAQMFGFQSRGLIQPGMTADLVIFDPDRVRDKATYAEPHRYSEGFDFVIVAGKVAVADGALTGIRAGQPLRRY